MSDTSTRPSRRRRFSVDTLFEDTRPQAVGVRDLASAKEIRLDRIAPDPEQPRRTFDADRLDDLVQSIRLEGVLQPIAVRYDMDHDSYVILHGERRWRAAQLAGLETIPAIVREVAEERRLIQQLMENIIREDLNAVDRAAALRVLKGQMDDAPWERVAEAVGIKRSRLFQLLGTEKLPAEVQEEIRSGNLSEKQSRVLQGLPEPVQSALARLIIHEGLNQTAAQRLARAARHDEEFLEFDDDAALERFKLLRGTAEAGSRRPQDTRSPNDVIDGALRRALGAKSHPVDIGADDEVPLAQVEAEIAALARSLARLSPAFHSGSEGAALTSRLRGLQDLIKLTLANR